MASASETTGESNNLDTLGYERKVLNIAEDLNFHTGWDCWQKVVDKNYDLH
jgi:hypothetical protein